MKHHSFAKLALVLGCSVFLTASSAEVNSKKTGVLEALLSANPVPVSLSPDGIWLLQKTLHANSFEIGLVHRPSKKYRFLANSSDTQLSLTWSPDSKTIAYQSSEGGNRHYSIHLLSVDSRTIKKLESSLSDTAAPRLRWSPEGGQLAFLTGKLGDGYKLVVADLGFPTPKLRVLVDSCNPDVDFDWSPDGKAMAYNSLSSPNTLSILSPNGEQNKNISVGSDLKLKHLDWSDDGQKILVTARSINEDYFKLFRLILAKSEVKLVETQPHDILRPYFIRNSKTYLFHLNREGKIQIVGEGAKVFKELSQIELGLEFRRLNQKENRAYLISSSVNESLGVMSWDLGKHQIEKNFPPVQKFNWEFTQPVLRVKEQNIPCFLWRAKTSVKERRLIIKIHGGPQLQEMQIWTMGSELLLQQGIDILVINYPGSTGYGIRFENDRQFKVQQEATEAAIAHAVTHWNISRANIALWGSSYGSLIALLTKACSREKMGPIFLESLGKLPPLQCDKVRNKSEMGIYVFQGANDNRANMTEIKKGLLDIFGRFALDKPNGALTLFEGEGHHFHKLSSKAQIYSSIMVAMGIPLRE